MTPIREYKIQPNHTAYYLGSDSPIVINGKRCECGCDEPVDMWFVITPEWGVCCTRKSADVPLPGYSTSGGAAGYYFSDLCEDYCKGRWTEYQRRFLRIAALALNEGYFPATNMKHYVGIYGIESILEMFSTQDIALTDKAVGEIVCHFGYKIPDFILKF